MNHRFLTLTAIIVFAAGGLVEFLHVYDLHQKQKHPKVSPEEEVRQLHQLDDVVDDPVQIVDNIAGGVAFATEHHATSSPTPKASDESAVAPAKADPAHTHDPAQLPANPEHGHISNIDPNSTRSPWIITGGAGKLADIDINAISDQPSAFVIPDPAIKVYSRYQPHVKAEPNGQWLITFEPPKTAARNAEKLKH